MPDPWKRAACTAGLLVLLLGLPAGAAARARGGPPEGSGTAAASDPNPGGRNYLYGVSALSSTDAWAAGYFCMAGCGGTSPADETLIAHWDGTAWSQVPSPNPSPHIRSRLFSVSADSPADAWAAGYYCAGRCGTPSAETDHTLIEHWDGTAWSQVPSPNPAGMISQFLSVSADSPTDAWAAGYSCTVPCAGTAVHQTLIAHWNGTTWSRVRSPDPGLGNAVATGVSARTTGDAWTAGTYCTSACGTPSETDHTLIARWNGTTWSTVASPSPTTTPVPEAVTAGSATDAWVVGWSNSTSGSRPLLLHWNGTTWATVPPGPGQGADLLRGVSATSATDAWAVGQVFAPARGGFATAILHWNGTTWARVPSPSPGQHTNQLSGASADSPADAWAVGYYCLSRCAQINEQDRTLILHWNGTAWSRS
jgi:hypothetical protein